MYEPYLGEPVLVRASHVHRLRGLKVQSHGDIAGRFFEGDEWQPRAWDEWLHTRYRAGEIEFIRPADLKTETPKE